MNKLFIVVLGVFLLSGCGAGNDGETQAANEATVLTIGHIVAEGTPIDEGIKYFGDLIEERTDGEVTVEVYDNASLGGNREMLESVQSGTLDATLPTTASLNSFSDKTMLFDLPYLIKNREGAESVLDGDIGDQLMVDLEEVGFKGVSWMTQGFRHLTVNANEPPTQPEDFNGLRLRTLENPVHVNHFEALGSSVVPIEFSELYTSLQQGVIDGQENPYSNIEMSGLYEVQDYIVETAHIYDAIPLLFSQLTWDQLSDEHKSIINEAGKEASEYQRNLQDEQDNDLKNSISESGNTEIIELSEEEREALREHVSSVYDQYEEQIGVDIIEEALNSQ